MYDASYISMKYNASYYSDFLFTYMAQVMCFFVHRFSDVRIQNKNNQAFTFSIYFNIHMENNTDELSAFVWENPFVHC